MISLRSGSKLRSPFHMLQVTSIYKITESCVCETVQETLYGGEILHADPCRTHITDGLGQMYNLYIVVIIGKTLYF